MLDAAPGMSDTVRRGSDFLGFLPTLVFCLSHLDPRGINLADTNYSSAHRGLSASPREHAVGLDPEEPLMLSLARGVVHRQLRTEK